MGTSIPLPAPGPPRFYKGLFPHFPGHGALAGPVHMPSLRVMIMGWKGSVPMACGAIDIEHLKTLRDSQGTATLDSLGGT